MESRVTIDFPDDLWQAEGEWTEDALRELVSGYAQRGISAIHWIEYGTRSGGMWDPGSYLDRKGTAAPFSQKVPNPLRVIAEEAHRQRR